MVGSSLRANMLMPMRMPCARANKMGERSIIAEINKVREIVIFKNKCGLRL